MHVRALGGIWVEFLWQALAHVLPHCAQESESWGEAGLLLPFAGHDAKFVQRIWAISLGSIEHCGCRLFEELRRPPQKKFTCPAADSIIFMTYGRHWQTKITCHSWVISYPCRHATPGVWARHHFKGGPYNWNICKTLNVLHFGWASPAVPQWLGWSTENSGSWHYLSWLSYNTIQYNTIQHNIIQYQ